MPLVLKIVSLIKHFGSPKNYCLFADLLKSQSCNQAITSLILRLVLCSYYDLRAVHM